MKLESDFVVMTSSIQNSANHFRLPAFTYVFGRHTAA